MSMMGCQCHRCAGSEIARVAGSESECRALPVLSGVTRGSLQLRPVLSQQLHLDTSQRCEGGKEVARRWQGGAGERRETARGVSVDIVTHALTRHCLAASVLFPDQKAPLSPHIYCLSVSEEMRRPGEVTSCEELRLLVPHCHHIPARG